jgi:manganese/zinc/iron transport system substrate-binding protein
MVARALEVPRERRVLITAHRAFDYLGRRLGLETRSVQGTSAVAGIDSAAIDRVADVVLARGIPIVFAETSRSREDLEAVRVRVEAEGGSVKLAGPLYADAMGSPETVEGSYIGMMGHNVNALVNALATSR